MLYFGEEAVKCGVCGEKMGDLDRKVSTWSLEGHKFGGKASLWSIQVEHHHDCAVAVDFVPMTARVIFCAPRYPAKKR